MNIKSIVKNLVIIGIGCGTIGTISYFNKKQVEELERKCKRAKSYYSVCQEWLNKKQNKVSINDFFENNEIKNIAIYGMGSLGELFYNEISDSNVSVKCFVDKNAEAYSIGIDDIPVVQPQQLSDFDDIDAVVITPVHEYENIENAIKEIGFTEKIVSLEDVIYE